MGLNTISSILEKRGSEYLNKFLSETITITEKLDTYRILFEKQNDKLVFYKKDNTPLNLIERTITNVWEDAIIELTTIIGDTILPEGLTFGIAYTPVERPIRLPYSKIPKYILTDISLRKNNKICESFNYEEVTKWASILHIGRPPIIFEGKLTEDQIQTIFNYGICNFDNIVENNFAEIINNLFGKSYSEEGIIEGIIIKNNDELIQLISHEFNLLNESYQKEENTRDYYDIILLKLNNFLDSYNLPILESKTSDEMYLEITSDVFNNFCNKNPLIVENLKPDFLTPPAYGYYGNLNLLLIKNKKTLDILEKGGKIYEALYRVIVTSLRKTKKHYGLISESDATKFNTYVNVIKNLINEEIEFIDNINESIDNYIDSMSNVQNINESRSDNVVIDAMNTKQYSDIDNMRIIASVQKTFEPSISNIQKGETKAVIYITECQPFTISQMENIESIHRMWKCPIIIGSISNSRRNKGSKFHVSDDVVKAQLDSVAIFNKEIIPAYFMMDSWNLIELFEYCRPKYEPIAVITDSGKKSQFAIQLYFEDEVMGGRINVDKEFNIGEMEIKDKLAALRSIEDNNISSFKMVTPQAIWNFYDNIYNEYKVWSGQVLKPTTFQGNNFI